MKSLYLLLITIVLNAFGADYLSYDKDDWISYKNFRFINTITTNNRYAYIGSNNSILIFDLWQNKWQNPITSADGLKVNNIRKMYSKENGDKIWIQSDNGMICYNSWAQYTETNPWENPFDSLPPSPSIDTRNLFVDRPFLSGRNAIKDASLNSYSISTSTISDRDHLFIGTWGLGIGVGSYRMKHIKIKPFGLWGNDVSCITFNNNSIWFGSVNEGISKYDQQQEKWSHYYKSIITSINNNSIRSSFNYANKIWFGTDRGIVRYNTENADWEAPLISKLYNHSIYSFAIQDSSILWIGTDAGLCQYNLKDDIFKWIRNSKLPRIKIYTVLALNDELWIGTDYGLFKIKLVIRQKNIFNPKDSTVNIKTHIEYNWKQITSLPYIANRKTYILYDDSAKVWAGTDDGLYYLNKDGKIGEKTSIQENIYTICKTDKYLWLGTDNGIIMYDVVNDRFIRYTKEDGLINNTVLELKMREEYIWIGTPKGVTRCNWKNVQSISGY